MDRPLLGSGTDLVLPEDDNNDDFNSSIDNYEEIPSTVGSYEILFEPRVRRFCNPCCFCTGSCNLRRNCIAAGVAFIVVGFTYFPAFVNLPSSVDCEDPRSVIGTTSDHDQVTGTSVACHYYSSLRAGYTASIVLSFLFRVGAGVCILLACFLRIKLLALGSAILTPFATFGFIAVYTLGLMLQHFTYYDGGKYQGTFAVKKTVQLYMVTLASILLLVDGWIIICFVQLMKFIGANIDMDPSTGKFSVAVAGSDPKTSEIHQPTGELPPPPYSNVQRLQPPDIQVTSASL